MPTRDKTIEKHIFVPDIHFPFHDKKSLDTVYAFTEWFQPDVFTQLGDLVDFYDLSFYDKDPMRLSSLQLEVEMARNFWQKIHNLCPDAKKFMKEGNHEDRFYRFLCKNPAIAALDDLSLPKIFRLDKYGVEYSHFRDLLFFNDNLMVLHGQWASRKTAASKHLEELGVNCVFGHTHRASTASKKNFGVDITALECGFLGDMGEGFSFMGASTGDWRQAIGIGYYDSESKSWQLELLPIKNHKIFYGGKVFKASGAQDV